MKQLIVDYIPFEVSPQQINEAMKENDGKLVVKGVLQRADAKNQNGRVYPLSILQREAKNYNDGFIKKRFWSTITNITISNGKTSKEC